MYPPKFDYHRPASIEEAVTLLKANDGAKVMAGGHSLIPVMKLRLADPGTIIDIGRIVHKGIGTLSNTVIIGAGTTHAEIAASTVVPEALSEAAGMIGDPQVRNRGTIGGNIAHADPASDLPTVLMAINATVSMTNNRTVNARDFFVDLFETTLEEDEIIDCITTFGRGGNSGSAYAKLFNPASRYAMVGAAASLDMSDGKVTGCSVAIGGLTPTPKLCAAVADALVGTTGSTADIQAAAAHVADVLGDDVMGDIHASADYRRQMAPVFVARALTSAVARASA